MRATKKFIALLLALVMTLSMFAGLSLTAGAIENTEEWRATAFADIPNEATVLIVNSNNVALPNATTTSSGPGKVSVTVTASGSDTVTISSASGTLDELAWTADTSNESGTKFRQFGSTDTYLRLSSTGSNSALRVDAVDSNNVFVMGAAGKLLKLSNAARYVGEYVDGGDWRTYNTETAANYAGQSLTFYVLASGGTAATTFPVTWYNGDGTELTTTNVEENTAPAYTEAEPTKADDTVNHKYYVFAGWAATPDGTPVDLTAEVITAATSYYAVYTEHTMATVNWITHDGTDTQYINPESFAIPAPGEYTENSTRYVFTGWTPAPNATPIADGEEYTFTAQYTASVSKQYTLVTADNAPEDWSGEYIIAGRVSSAADKINTFALLDASNPTQIVDGKENAINIGDANATLTVDGAALTGAEGEIGNVIETADDNLVWLIEQIDPEHGYYTIREKNHDVYISSNGTYGGGSNSMNFSLESSAAAQWMITQVTVTHPKVFGGSSSEYTADMVSIRNVQYPWICMLLNTVKNDDTSRMFRGYYIPYYNRANVDGYDKDSNAYTSEYDTFNSTNRAGTGSHEVEIGISSGSSTYNLVLFGNPNPFKAQIIYQGEQKTIVNPVSVQAGRTTTVDLTGVLIPDIAAYPNYSLVSGPNWSISMQSNASNPMTIDADGKLLLNGAVMGNYALVTLSYTVHDSVNNVDDVVSTQAKVEVIAPVASYATVIYEGISGNKTEQSYTVSVNDNSLPLDTFLIDKATDAASTSADCGFTVSGTPTWTASSRAGNTVSITDGVLDLSAVTTEDLITVRVSGLYGTPDGGAPIAADSAVYYVYVTNKVVAQITHTEEGNAVTGNFSVPFGTGSIPLGFKNVCDSDGSDPADKGYDITGTPAWSIVSGADAVIDAATGTVDASACAAGTVIRVQFTGLSYSYDGSAPAAMAPAYVLITVSEDNTLVLAKDTFVVDFGKPVVLHPLQNDAFPQGSTKAIAAVYMEDGTTPATDFVIAGDSVTYTPPANEILHSKMVYKYAVRVNGEVKAELGTIVIIPANNLYYEATSSLFTFTGSWEQGHMQDGTFVPSNTIEVNTQQENIPGDGSVYGYEENYNNSSAAVSDGYMYKATVASGDSKTATFEFYGTGFDINSLCSKDTGVVVVDYYAYNNSTNSYPTTRTDSLIVDTYVGYTYTETAVPMVDASGNAVYKYYKPEEGDTASKDYNLVTTDNTYWAYQFVGVGQGEYARVQKTTNWVKNSESTGAFYNVPVLSMSGLPYNRYKVVIKPTYVSFFDNNKATANYDFCLDSVRIYDPCGTTATLDNEVADVYAQDGEYGAGYININELLTGEAVYSITYHTPADVTAPATQNGLRKGSVGILADAPAQLPGGETTYTFVGWAPAQVNNQTASGTVLAPQSVVAMAGDLNYYALYSYSSGDTTYYTTELGNTVTYTIEVLTSANGSASANVNTAAAGTTVTLTATPDDGYVFDHWYVIDGEANEITMTGNTFEMPASDVTVEATFVAIPTTNYTVSFSVPAGVDSVSDMTCASGSSITLPTPTGDPSYNAHDYVFAGWVDAAVDNSTTEPTILTAGSEYTVTANTTLIALYTYAAGGGATYEPVTSAQEDWSGSYIIVNSDKDYALSSSFLSGNGGEFKGTAVTVTEDDKITNPDASIVWVFEKNSDTTGYYIHNDSGYIKIDGTSSTSAALTAAEDDSFTIVASSTTGVWKLVSKTNSGRSLSYYSGKNSFRTYASSNNTGYLFKATSATYYTTVLENAAAHEHTVEHVDAVEATCTETGNVEYYYCSAADCPLAGKYFSDAALTDELTVTVIDALGHDFGEWTYNGNETHSRTCSRCNVVETDDCTWDDGVETTPPTATETGVRTYTCTVCSGTKTEAIPALGEDYTVSFTVPEGVTAISDMTCASGSSITLPTLTGTPSFNAHDYVFAGWVDAAVNNSTTAPTILTAGSDFTPSANTALIALYTYSEGTGGVAGTDYALTEASAIAAGDEVIITELKNGTYYAMTNDNGTGDPPDAVAVTVTDSKIATAADNLKWNVSNDNGNLTIYPNGTTDTWLYCTSTNNGVRVGTNANKIFTIDEGSGYLKHTGTGRYLGVYNTQDWRCYDNTTGNIAGQTLGFYVKSAGGGSTTYYTTVLENIVTYTIDVLTSANGSASANVSTAAAGDTVTLTATPNEGYKFSAWTVLDGNADEVVVTDNTFEMPASDVTVEATFVAEAVTPTTYAIDVSGQTNGTVTATPNPAEAGTTVTLTATPDDGYEFDHWYVIDGEANEITMTGNTFEMPASDVTVGATFVTAPVTGYTVTLSDNGTTSTLSGTTVTLPSGTATGYTFEGWVTSATPATETQPATIPAGSYTPTADITLYALYSYTESSGGSGDYVKVTTAPANWAGDYVIVYEDGSLIFDSSLETLDAVSNYQEVTITNETITAAQGDAYKFTVAASGSGYSILAANGKYIGKSANSNGLDSSTSEVVNRITINTDGTVNIIGAGGAYLRYNATSGQNRFRYFKSSSYTAQKPLALYAKSSGGGTPTTYYSTTVGGDGTSSVAPQQARAATPRGALGEVGASDALFIDGNGAAVVDDYKSYGPNNEVYLTAGQAVALTLNTSEVDLASIQIGMKTVDGSTNTVEATIQICNGTTPVATFTQTVQSSAAMYYDLTKELTDAGFNWKQHNYTIIITNTNTENGGLLSLTNIKWTVPRQAQAPKQLRAYVNEETTRRALKTVNELMGNETPAEPENPGMDLSALRFKSASLNLANGISTNFIANAELLDTFDTVWAVVTGADGNDVRIDAVQRNADLYFTYTGSTALDMGAEFTATIYGEKNGVTYTGTSKTYSIKEYAMNMLAKETSSAELKTLCADLLNYGAAAQTFKGVNLSALANADMTDEMRAYASDPAATVLNDFAVKQTTDSTLGRIASASLNLVSNIELNYYLQLPAADGAALTLTYTAGSGEEKTVVLDASDLVANGSYYVATFRGLQSVDLRCVITATLTVNGETAETLSYSVESYAARKAAGSDANLSALVKAIMTYGDAASTFFGYAVNSENNVAE